MSSPSMTTVRLTPVPRQALARRPRRPKDEVSFRDERCVFSHSDISLDNFLWDPVTKQVWLVDCQHINVLPESFFSLYLHCNTQLFIKDVTAQLNLRPSSKLALLESASGSIIQSGNSSFGKHQQRPCAS